MIPAIYDEPIYLLALSLVAGVVSLHGVLLLQQRAAIVTPHATADNIQKYSSSLHHPRKFTIRLHIPEKLTKQIFRNYRLPVHKKKLRYKPTVPISLFVIIRVTELSLGTGTHLILKNQTIRSKCTSGKNRSEKKTTKTIFWRTAAGSIWMTHASTGNDCAQKPRQSSL